MNSNGPFKELTSDEAVEATGALEAWFKSQQINPLDAAVLMLLMAAGILVKYADKPKSSAKLFAETIQRIVDQESPPK